MMSSEQLPKRIILIEPNTLVTIQTSRRTRLSLNLDSDSEMAATHLVNDD